MKKAGLWLLVLLIMIAIQGASTSKYLHSLDFIELLWHNNILFTSLQIDKTSGSVMINKYK